MLATICINFLETLSRSLCDFLPGEMLTKGQEKLKRVDLHYAQVKDTNQFPVMGGNSSDASHWCQKFVMKVFIIMFSQFLPTDVLCTLARILNLVTKKKLDLSI